jgi:hypothetical protein
MKLISFGGQDINDDENYRSSLTPAGQTPAEGLPQPVGRTGAAPLVGGVVFPERYLQITTELVNTSALDKRALQAQWYSWFLRDTARSLIVADDDGGNQRYVEAVPFSVLHDADGDGWVLITSLIVNGDDLWRAVTATTDSWNITATGATKTLTNGTTALNDDAYPVITVIPRDYATGINPYKRFVTVRWRADQPATGYPTDIVNAGLDTRIASTNFDSATGADIRVYVDTEDTDYWLNGINTATTSIWCNLDFQAGQSSPLAVALGTGALTTVALSNDITGWPGAGLFEIDSELFSYTGKNTSSRQLTGISRAAKGTTAASHSAAATVYWIQHEIWLEYGSSAFSALTPDDDNAPMFELASSTNTSWDYNNFYEAASGSAPLTSGTGFGWWAFSNFKNTAKYGGNQAASANPYVELGIRGTPTGTKIAIDGAWSLFNPCGISSANFQNGQFYHGRVTWWGGAVRSSVDGTIYTTEYSIPTSTNDTWNSWSQNVSLTSGSRYVLLSLAGYASLADPSRVEAADVTVALNSTYTPTVRIGGEQTTYRLSATLTNTTTGEAVTIDIAMDTDESLEIDVATSEVTYLADNSSQFGAVTPVGEPRRHLLRLQAGVNELQYDESGVVEVDMTFSWERRFRV